MHARRRFGKAVWGPGALALLLGLAAAPSPAHAEFIAFSTTINIDAPTALPAGSTVSGNGTSVAVLTLNNGNSPADTITLTGETGGSGLTHLNALPPGGVDILPIDVTVSTNPTTPLTNVALTFTAIVNVLDFSSPSGGVATGNGTIELTGRLSGTIGVGVKDDLSTLTGYATIPANGVFQAGATPYTLTPGAYTPPTPTQAGTLGAHVVADIPFATGVPEPASLTLLGLGALGLLGCGWRRRRRAA
jgi:hypothetical protein